MNTKSLIFVIGLLCAFFLLPYVLKAQSTISQYTIVGQAIDSLRAEPIDYLTVVLKDNKDSILVTTFSQQNGSFAFSDLKSSSYSITFFGLGYERKTISVQLDDSSRKKVDLKQVLIAAATNNLAQVSITGSKPLIKQGIDRISYDLEADPESKNNSVLDMMRKVPMLSLDAEDNVQLKGETNIKILINGKPSSMMVRNPKEVLRSMPASTIHKIEVITTPPSKYDAEGLTGIINIITKKNTTDGYNGAINLYNAAPLGGPGSGSSFSLKRGKLGLTVFGGGGIYNTPHTISEMNRRSFSTFKSDLVQNDSKHKNSHSGYLGTEFSYDMDSINLLSAEFNMNGSKSRLFSNQHSILKDQAGLVQRYHLENAKNGKGSGLDLSVNYQLGFKRNKSKLITFSYRFNEYEYDEYNDLSLSDQFNYPQPNYTQANIGSAAENTFQVDFIQTINKVNIEAGIKGIFRQNASIYQSRAFNEASGAFDLVALQSNEFNNVQHVYAAYNTYQFNLKSWGFKFGLRIEKTMIEADFITTDTKLHQHQLNLIPALAISKKLENKNSLNMGYTQRIQRPGLYQLNPFVDRSNPNVQISGNPNLRPVMVNSLQIGYSIQGAAFININLDYSSFKGLINQVATYDSATNMTKIAYQNTGKASMLSSNLSLNYAATKYLSVNVNAKAALARIAGSNNGLPVETEGLMYTISISPGYKFDAGWRVNGNLYIKSKSFTLQRVTNDYVSSSFTLSKELLKNKLTLSTMINNPFSKYRNSLVNLDGPGFEQLGIEKTYFRSYRVSLNYNFGKLQDAIKKNKRGIKNDDVSSQ